MSSEKKVVSSELKNFIIKIEFKLIKNKKKKEFFKNNIYLYFIFIFTINKIITYNKMYFKYFLYFNI